MINKQEIMKHAAKHSLPANTIEKDYILNWLLAGIVNSEELRDKWIFKGGTCLKKCYFENYRFSEDLDFTISDASHINTDFLLDEFEKISRWVYEHSGVELPVARIDFEEYKNPRGNISITGKLAYSGPMQRRGNMSTVKLDLSNDELIVCTPERKGIHHPYSDWHIGELKVLTYMTEEIFSEKLRAFAERMRPRDLYDVIHLYKDDRWHLNRRLVLDVLEKKCQFKDIGLPTMPSVEKMSSKADLVADWNDMLAHQINPLKPCEYYWGQLPGLFEWLYGK